MTKIILADDHKILREGLRSLLEQQGESIVIAEANSGEEVIRLAAEKVPDMVIMDITMPGTNGIEAARQILEDQPTIKIIALSMHSDKRFVMKMLSVGARGYLLKNCAFEELSIAIKTVMGNQFYVSPGVAGDVIGEYISYVKSGTLPADILTDKEIEIIRLLAAGKTAKEIAILTNVSAKSVMHYRQRIMERLKIETTVDLVKYAIREGLTSIGE